MGVSRPAAPFSAWTRSERFFERRELFTSDTSDVAANREALRIVVSEHIPAFVDQAFTFPSTAAIQEYFEASR